MNLVALITQMDHIISIHIAGHNVEEEIMHAVPQGMKVEPGRYDQESYAEMEMVAGDFANQGHYVIAAYASEYRAGFVFTLREA